MEKIKRRALIKSLGALSIGIATPTISKGDVLAEPYKEQKKKIKTDMKKKHPFVSTAGFACVTALK